MPHISGSGSFGAGARTDSAFDLAAVEAVAKYSAGALGTPNAAAKAARDATTSVSEEAAKTAAVVYEHGSAGPFSSPRSVGFLPALAEEDVVSGVAGKLGALALGKGLGYAAASPVSIIDVSGTSSASSVGTPREGSVDGAGFALPEWVKTPAQ